MSGDEANKEVNNKVLVHPFTNNPDKCYQEEEKKGRFKNLSTLDNVIGSPQKENTVRFVCISDTHDRTDTLAEELPDGDVLIHAGDFTGASAEEEIIRFNTFLDSIKTKYKHIVVIAGNHELSFDPKVSNQGGLKISLFKLYFGKNPLAQQVDPGRAKELLTNCMYLENETVELFGIKIYGAPWQPPHFDLAFNKTRGENILEEWDKIPLDTDILVTHGPPLGIGDKITKGYHVGCAELLSTIQERVRPKYHVFGHIHESHGIYYDGSTTFINAAICDKKYNPVQKPVVFDYVISPS